MVTLRRWRDDGSLLYWSVEADPWFFLSCCASTPNSRASFVDWHLSNKFIFSCNLSCIFLSPTGGSTFFYVCKFLFSALSDSISVLFHQLKEHCMSQNMIALHKAVVYSCWICSVTETFVTPQTAHQWHPGSQNQMISSVVWGLCTSFISPVWPHFALLQQIST